MLYIILTLSCHVRTSNLSMKSCKSDKIPAHENNRFYQMGKLSDSLASNFIKALWGYPPY